MAKRKKHKPGSAAYLSKYAKEVNASIKKLLKLEEKLKKGK